MDGLAAGVDEKEWMGKIKCSLMRSVPKVRPHQR
jgi:hypothetical protein